MSDATDHIEDNEAALALYFSRPPMLFHNEHGEVILPVGSAPTWVEATPTGSVFIIVMGGMEVRIAVTESPAAVWAAFVAALVPPEPPSAVKPFRRKG